MTTEYIEEARDCVLAIGGGRPAGDTYDRMLWRVVERTGLTYVRAWKLLYRKVRHPNAVEMDVLRRAREKQEALVKKRWSHFKADRDWAETVSGFERLKQDVDQGAICRGDATALHLAPPPNNHGGRTGEEVGRLLAAKAHQGTR